MAGQDPNVAQVITNANGSPPGGTLLVTATNNAKPKIP
jgi:hypothetical protein